MMQNLLLQKKLWSRVFTTEIFTFFEEKEEWPNFTCVADYNYFQHIQARVSICLFLS